MGRRGIKRTSCDVCFAKKVRCDLASQTPSSICSYCLRHGLTCTTASAVSRADLFGVSGLDRQTLDQAIQGYFSHDAICKPLAPPQLFLPRYHAALDAASDVAVQPVSTVLILAVAACGVAWLEALGRRRFEMQDDMVEAIAKLAGEQADDGNALDKIEAIALVWDLESRHKLVRLHESDPLAVHPLSDEAIVRLVLRHGLHTSTPSTPLRTLRDIQGTPSTTSSGTPSSSSSSASSQPDVDTLRRTILFWMVYADDALLRFESGRLPLIHEDEVDAPMLPAEFGTPFYRDWITALLSLAVLLRGASLNLCSARSKRLGLAPAHVAAFLAALESWRRSLPASVAFLDDEAESSSVYDVVSQSDPEQWASVIQRAFLELTFYGLHTSVHILAAQVGLEGEGSPHASTARAALDQATLTALDAIVWRSQRCAKLGFLDYSNLVLRTIPRGCAYYSLLLSDAALMQGLPCLAEHLLRQSERLGDAISSLTSHPDAEEEAQELQAWQALRGSRLSLEAAGPELVREEVERFKGGTVMATSTSPPPSQEDDRARPFAFDANLFTDPAYLERILEEPLV